MRTTLCSAYTIVTDARATAPKPIKRHVVITAPPAQPDAPKTEEGEAPVYKNEPRQNYPVEMLTHRFLPVGSESARPSLDSAKAPMDVDEDDEKEEAVKADDGTSTPDAVVIAT